MTTTTTTTTATTTRLAPSLKQKHASTCTVWTMELMSLEKGQRIVPGMKREREVCCMVDSHMRSGVCKNKSGFDIRKSLLRNYSNLMESGPPQRVLFYENGEWTDFPEGVIDLLIDTFSMKKMAIEIELRGNPSLLDFIHMILVDLKTGLQQPIAWFGKDGISFFPEAYSVSDELHDCFQSGGRENRSLLSSEPNGSHGIKLQLEITVSTDDNLKMGECNEGSDSQAKRVKVDESPSERPALEIVEGIGENSPSRSLPLKDFIRGSPNWKFTSYAVEKMFIKGMGPSICVENIHSIQGTSSFWVQARLELFEKQVEITGRYRGNANVRYAWLASSKEAVSRISMHGLGFNELRKTKASYGIGVQLTPLSCSHISARSCDIDENGLQHMVLCRVILGNVELVHPGSEQCYPSCEDFDSGVNDRTNPEHYIIWNMNMSTHIFPEYVVSFKRSSGAKGHASESCKDQAIGITNSTISQENQRPNSSLVDLVGDCHPTQDSADMVDEKTLKFAGPPPKSPWIPLPLLLVTLEPKLSYRAMKSVYHVYGQFKNKKISRDGLIQSIRSVVGDPLLKAAIIHFRGKFGQREWKVRKEEGSDKITLPSAKAD